MNRNIEIVLFDLGGVVIELDGPPIKPHWSKVVLTHEENWLRWFYCEAVKLFETGQLNETQFCENVIDELALDISPQQFKQEFKIWPKGFLDGAKELLVDVRRLNRTAYFSNTNPLHLPRLIDDLQLNAYFDHHFSSYDIGFFKPDTEGYDYVVSECGVQPEQVLFLDDNQINIDGARASGLQAHKVVGVLQARAVIDRYGLFD